MDLKQLKIGPAKQARLKEAGISTVEALARADETALAAKTGYPVAAVRELKQQAAALALVDGAKHLGAHSIPTLADRAMDGLKEAYQASADKLAHELKVAQEAVAKFQAEAQAAATRLMEEAKTPEGRKRIAVATQAAARDAATRVEAEAKATLEKAKEFQAKAPEYLAEARERTEKILKDAEAQIREVAERAQARLQADAEKVRAAVAPKKAAAQSSAPAPASARTGGQTVTTATNGVAKPRAK